MDKIDPVWVQNWIRVSKLLGDNEERDSGMLNILE